MTFNSRVYNVEGYEEIPSWICSALVSFGNCAINNKTLKKIGGEKALKKYCPNCRITQKGKDVLIEVVRNEH